MPKLKQMKHISGEFGSVSIGERIASLPITFKLREDAESHVGEIWASMFKRRLLGTISLGDSPPNQTSLVDTIHVEGSFDTGAPTFGIDKCTIKLSFDHSEVDANTMIEFSHKGGFLSFDKIEDIPAKAPKNEGGKETLWNTEPTALLGIDNNVVQMLFEKNIKTVEDIVDFIAGEHDAGTMKSLSIPLARRTEIKDKTALFLRDQGQPVPWEKDEDE